MTTTQAQAIDQFTATIFAEMPTASNTDIAERCRSLAAEEGEEMLMTDLVASVARVRASTTDARALVRTALRRLGKGRLEQEIRLADLRAALSSLSRKDVDAALIALQDDGILGLHPYRADHQRNSADAAAAIKVCGEPRHCVYLRR